jgi:TolA protein
VAESRKKIMQAEAANIAVMQQNIQDFDLKMQDKIRANSISEQEDAESFAKAESTREVEMKKIAVEQNEIDRLLVDNEKRSKELAQQLIDLTEKGNVLSKQAEIKQLREKTISGIKQKINSAWSDMAGDIDSSLSGLDPQTTSKFKCTIDVKLDSNGKILDSIIVKNSGYAGFDNAAQNAVNNSSPLPVPNNDEMFEKEFKSIGFIFSRNAVVLK